MSVFLPQLRRVRWAVRATLVLGVAASVVANVLHPPTVRAAGTVSAAGPGEPAPPPAKDLRLAA